MLEQGNTEFQALEPFLDLLRCPVSGSALTIADGGLRSASNDHYALWENTIPLFAKAYCSAEGRLQQSHYDDIAAAYSANLGYPHTIEYMAYLDRVLDEALEETRCLRGDLLRLR